MTKRAKVSDFVEVSTIHHGELWFWWAEEKLFDGDYHIKVHDSTDAKVRELEAKYGVQDDTQLRCQFEGRRLLGEDRDKVEAAIKELARHLMRFKGVVPLQ